MRVEYCHSQNIRRVMQALGEPRLGDGVGGGEGEAEVVVVVQSGRWLDGRLMIARQARLHVFCTMGVYCELRATTSLSSVAVVPGGSRPRH